MESAAVNLSRIVLAGLAAGAWIVLSGMLMAGLFGYREMQSAFASSGLRVPAGSGVFVKHVAIRLAMGLTLAWLYLCTSRVVAPGGLAILCAAALGWLLYSLLPWLMILDWRIFSASVIGKTVAWSAGEALVATAIVAVIYRS